MTAVVAVSLAFVSSGLKERQADNERLAAKVDILKAVGFTDVSKTEAASIFDERVEGLVLSESMTPRENGGSAIEVNLNKERKLAPADQRYPLYIYRHEGQTRYIIPLYGNGLWDKIWGYVALEEDMQTIAGISLDHKAETPGLGAEIKDNPRKYNDPFIGKSIYNEQGQYVSVVMKKGKLDDPDHQIDAITGATITADGVSAMMVADIRAYLPYFESLKNVN